jgi:hypothetical protein
MFGVWMPVEAQILATAMPLCNLPHVLAKVPVARMANATMALPSEGFKEE